MQRSGLQMSVRSKLTLTLNKLNKQQGCYISFHVLKNKEVRHNMIAMMEEIKVPS